MRRAGAHIRTDRKKLALLQRTTLNDHRIAPSLRSNHVKKLLKNREQKQTLQQHLQQYQIPKLIVDRPSSRRCSLNARRRKRSLDESPRSLLKPQHTHGVATKFHNTAEITVKRSDERRKYRSFGIQAPVHSELLHRQLVLSRSGFRSSSLDLTSNWRNTIRNKFNKFRSRRSQSVCIESSRTEDVRLDNSSVSVKTTDKASSNKNMPKKLLTYRKKIQSAEPQPTTSASSKSNEDDEEMWSAKSSFSINVQETNVFTGPSTSNFIPPDSESDDEINENILFTQSRSSVNAPETTFAKIKKSVAIAEASWKNLNLIRHLKNAPSGSSEGGKLNSRRNSVFVKRGSITMDPIKKVDLEDVYTVNKQLGTGRFGYIKLAEHKQSGCKIAIKFFPRPQTKQVDFVREYNYSFFLSPHQHIIDTYEFMYQASNDSAFFFVQEFCPSASLREAVEASNQTGIGEEKTKKVFAAVLSAIEFMHDENLVHRNLKAENILIFDSNDYSRVKVTDFGLTRKVDATVKYLEYVNNYHATELCDTVVNETLTVNKSTDIWALGIIFFYCMKGRFPWQKASIMCKPYWEWEQWLKRKNPALPKKFAIFSEKALKLFKKSITPRPKDRWSAKDMRKCIAKDKLLKTVKKPDDVYAVSGPSRTVHRHHVHVVEEDLDQPEEGGKKKSAIQQWLSTTLSTMAEISEQVVSARDD